MESAILIIRVQRTLKIPISKPPTDATVSLQMVNDTMEGSDVEVCVDLSTSSVPVGGLESDVVVMLNTTDGTKAS